MRVSKHGIEARTARPTASVLVESESLTYKVAQRFVENQYKKVHRASIECDFPTLMAACDHRGQLLAAAGIRAPGQRFFLENYLEKSAEQVLSDRFNNPVAREKIIEVGNLAGGRDRLATLYLMHQMWEYLIRCGFEYLILTGTRSLLYKFRQLPLHHLADANAEQIPGASKWGSYYDDEPRVVTGRLADYDFRFFKTRMAAPPYQFEILNAGVER